MRSCVDVRVEGPTSLALYPSVAQVANPSDRSRLSTRSAVTREANRRGLLAGVVSRGGRPLGVGEAKVAAADSASGADPFGNCSVPAYWRPLFKRAFVKAAVYAAHTERTVSAR